eukprot:scaffold17871_cov82-Phaeocystis_antarctica.AAC.9
MPAIEREALQLGRSTNSPSSSQNGMAKATSGPGGLWREYTMKPERSPVAISEVYEVDSRSNEALSLASKWRVAFGSSWLCRKLIECASHIAASPAALCQSRMSRLVGERLPPLSSRLRLPSARRRGLAQPTPSPSGTAADHVSPPSELMLRTYGRYGWLLTPSPASSRSTHRIRPSAMSARSFSFGPSSDSGAEAASRMVPAYSHTSPTPSVARYATTDVALRATAGSGLACGDPQ